MAKHYRVLRENRRVLVFDDQPGVLLSTAVRSPGFTPPTHAFLNAQALDARHENALAALLLQAHSVAEFIALLERAGFVVEREEN